MRKTMLWLLASLGLFLAACVDTAAAPQADGCSVSKIVDGDTLHLTCGGMRHKVRLLDYDSPELYHPNCPAEYQAAEAATAQLRALTEAGPVTGVRFEGHDRYGRDLAHVAVNGRDLSVAMLATRYALPYQGHKHPDWCGLLTP